MIRTSRSARSSPLQLRPKLDLEPLLSRKLARIRLLVGAVGSLVDCEPRTLRWKQRDKPDGFNPRWRRVEGEHVATELDELVWSHVHDAGTNRSGARFASLSSSDRKSVV